MQATVVTAYKNTGMLGLNSTLGVMYIYKMI
jgi:hypothetical protein